MLDAGNVNHAFENSSAIGRKHGGGETQIELMNLVLRHRCRDPVNIRFGRHIRSPRRRARYFLKPPPEVAWSSAPGVGQQALSVVDERF
ncbi:hypothetical protein [Mesorhizobium sp.]|uniref:hypothetical protein n=1 Tax=Mesorhizobium sp. TaxID=1871066 RepID=UPI00257D43E8|nr:hypothetical protein [Mesorhizobium sp.]